MKIVSSIVCLLALTLAASSGHAEQSADDRAFATALAARLKTLGLEKQNCGRGVRVANQSAVDDAIACEKRIEAERTSINALLANPARLHVESERLRSELRQELLALLVDVRAAATILNAQSSYDEFELKLGPIGKRLESIRSKYQIPLSRGDHQALGAPISDACTKLYAVGPDWRQLRLAAQEVTGAQAAVSRAATWDTDFYQRHLRTAQLKQAEAQRRFTDRRAIALASVEGATRVAQEDSQRQRTVTTKP